MKLFSLEFKLSLSEGGIIKNFKYIFLGLVFLSILSFFIFYPASSVSAQEISKQDLISTNSPVTKTNLTKTTNLVVKLPILKSAKSKLGRTVKQGEVIGYQGGVPGSCGAGLSIGSHLHFEVRSSNESKNPRDYFGKDFIWPLPGYRVTQEYGPADWTPWYKFHTGIDLASYAGAPVRAAGGGKIVFDGITNGYGHLIIIEHTKVLRTYYGHLRCI